ncbi:MAG: DUF4381 domain-containing protein [Proteobacteria bacterium]|nr:DUF4381 domain-containing protein [Pseudomonadota bacterium]
MLQTAAGEPGLALRDIHVPAPPSWWPPAPGWWLVTLLAVVLGGFVFLRLRARWRRRRRRRLLLAEFEHVISSAGDDQPLLAAAMSAFLRRLAMRKAPAVAALSGDAWLDHLDAQFGGEEFSKGVGRALIDAPFRAHAQFDAPALIALARRSVLTLSESGHV